MKIMRIKKTGEESYDYAIPADPIEEEDLTSAQLQGVLNQEILVDPPSVAEVLAKLDRLEIGEELKVTLS